MILMRKSKVSLCEGTVQRKVIFVLIINVQRRYSPDTLTP